MNAVMALCHFCEAHGPSPIFYTHTLRDLKISEIAINAEAPQENCPGCSSIGKTAVMLSEDAESNANFLSTQISILADVVPLVKQAAVRSLSCEVSSKVPAIVHIEIKFNFFFFFNFSCLVIKTEMSYFSVMQHAAMSLATHFKYTIHKLVAFFDCFRSSF